MATPAIRRRVRNLIKSIEWIGLLLIIIATVIAIGQEVMVIYQQGRVELHDILLLFIYLEIVSMTLLYFEIGKLPVRYPIYIAIVAIARYIILGMKEMDGLHIIWMSLAVLVLALTSLVLRYGHHKYPYPSRLD